MNVQFVAYSNDYSCHAAAFHHLPGQSIPIQSLHNATTTPPLLKQVLLFRLHIITSVFITPQRGLRPRNSPLESHDLIGHVNYLLIICAGNHPGSGRRIAYLASYLRRNKRKLALLVDLHAPNVLIDGLDSLEFSTQICTFIRAMFHMNYCSTISFPSLPLPHLPFFTFPSPRRKSCSWSPHSYLSSCWPRGSRRIHPIITPTPTRCPSQSTSTPMPNITSSRETGDASRTS